MVHPGDSEGNMARPSNPSGHFTPSFPAPANISQCGPSTGARAPQLGRHPTADTLVPPAIGPQTLQPENQPRRTTMPGSWAWAPPVQQPGGQTRWAWAPPAQRPGIPATASPAAGGSPQAQPPRVPADKSFEEFLLEAGVLDQWTLDKIFLDGLVEEMVGDGRVSLGPVERDSILVSPGGGGGMALQASGAASSSVPSRHQVRLPTQDQETLGAGDQAAAVEARERRSRRMAKRKEAAARHHRPEKHAGTDYSASFQNTSIFFLQL
jgi:hypothetical protein